MYSEHSCVQHGCLGVVLPEWGSQGSVRVSFGGVLHVNGYTARQGMPFFWWCLHVKDTVICVCACLFSLNNTTSLGRASGYGPVRRYA